MGTDYTSCLLTWFLFSLIVKAYSGVRYGKLCRAMVPIWVNTVATNSSAGTIPITMDVTIKRLRIPKSLASFSIPLGTTINLTGAAIYKTILAFFVAEIFSGDVLGTMFAAKSEKKWNSKEFNESTAEFEAINVE